MQLTNILYNHQSIQIEEMWQILKIYRSLRFVVCALTDTWKSTQNRNLNWEVDCLVSINYT